MLGIDFGDFNLTGYDPRSSSLDTVDVAALPDSQMPVSLDSATQSFLNTGSALPSGDGKGLQFPISGKPVVGLETAHGQDVDLFDYQMPTLSVDARFMETFPVFPPFLNVILAGRIGAYAQFGFGFDTYGLQRI